MKTIVVVLRGAGALAACAVVVPAFAQAGTPPSPEANRIVAEATGGKLKKTSGSLKQDGIDTSYSAEVVDLNGDGQPEVFVSYGGPQFGRTGSQINLYIKGPDGRWKHNLGFGGEAERLKTRNLGFPDLKILGPGSCSPVWRYTGREYTIHKKCP
jgi:hypothetical protein